MHMKVCSVVVLHTQSALLTFSFRQRVGLDKKGCTGPYLVLPDLTPSEPHFNSFLGGALYK